MATYKWNVEELQRCAVRLDGYRKEIKQAKKRLESQLGILPEIFEGDAGSAFRSTLEGDINFITTYLESLEELEGRLVILTRDYYEATEDKIEQKVNHFRNRM